MNTHVTHLQTISITVSGIVQGVGFRPFVWQLATQMGLKGQVLNNSQGVEVLLNTTEGQAETFVSRLKSEHPPLAKIAHVNVERAATQHSFEQFTIAKSQKGDMQTQVSPDAATCPACIEEINSPTERRYHYPFTNCTHCGPRLTIINEAPYDRATTSMASFEMCQACRTEYEDPNDRRFHAQPIACPNCGPSLELVWLNEKQHHPAFDQDPLQATANLLKAGFIGAIKGLGGFHLACLATNEETVKALRTRKKRSNKAFALMVKDIATARRYGHFTQQEQDLLQSHAAPIVLVDKGQEPLPQECAPNLAQLGFMLPNTPLHHILLSHFDEPLIMTSGNLSNTPQIIEDEQACKKLKTIADFALLHNRPITNRVDDSVARITLGKPTLLRRARGYAPAPIELPNGFENAPDLLALGGELKSTFCLLKNGKAILSQHQGDLEQLATFTAYQKSIALYTDLFDHHPKLRVIDKHPEFLSSKYGQEITEQDQLPLIDAQHHHAHMAAAMGENSIGLQEEKCLGLIMDGVGFGLDGTIWGGELFYGDYNDFQRIGAFPSVPMPGAAAAVKEPWRNLVAHLETAIGYEKLQSQYPHLPLLAYLNEKPTPTILAMMNKGLNTPKGSSCGRLFDAVAASLNLSPDSVTYEGEAAMALEALVSKSLLQDLPNQALYKADIRNENGLNRLDFAPLWQNMLADLEAGKDNSFIATKFHKSLAKILNDWVQRACKGLTGQHPTKIALSGGCFQNQTLLEAVVPMLEAQGLTPLTQHKLPANDGGISYGQALIAAAQFMKGE